MRAAAIYDIHANLPALEAVCREVKEAAVDLVMVGGDVLPGPMRRESLDLLEHLDTPVRYIQGKGEREVLRSGWSTNDRRVNASVGQASTQRVQSAQRLAIG
jgi:Icc-related predicted phosphoesterase